MIRALIKSTVKKAIERVAGAPPAPPAPPPAPAWRAAPEPAPAPATPVEPVSAQAAPVEAPAAPEAPAPVEAAPAAAEAPSKKKGRGGKKKAAEPVAEAAPEAALPPQVEAAPVSADDVVGPAISMEELQAYIDEYVRPALQSDGGDMTLVKVEGDVVYVQLVGACKTCPSSTLTLRMGVENTLKEEFPQIRELVQVD